MAKPLINKIEKAGLIGRGGAGFPTAVKWKSVKNAHEKPKYVICNASEGEMGVFKDFHILKNHPEKIIKGMALAMDYLKTKEAYININAKYYKKLKKRLEKIFNTYRKGGYDFTIFQEHPSYIGGEETALLNAIEGKRIEPRLKPPFPSIAGLFGKPTLINNVETFYNVACVADNTYKQCRFYCISGKAKKPSTYYLPNNLTIEKILKITKNYPKFDFFVQIGGSASGTVLNKKQIKKNKMIGAGAIEIFSKKLKPREFLLRLFEFYKNESCGKCAPCREGTYQLFKIVKRNKTIQWGKIMEIIDTMEQTAFCGLGRSIDTPVKSYMKNILKIKI